MCMCMLMIDYKANSRCQYRRIFWAYMCESICDKHLPLHVCDEPGSLMLPRSVAVLPCHLGWRTLLKCNKTNHACLPACLTSTFAYGRQSIHTVIPAGVQAYVCVCVCVCTYARTWTHSRTHTHARTHASTHVHTHTHIHRHKHDTLRIHRTYRCGLRPVPAFHVRGIR